MNIIEVCRYPVFLLVINFQLWFLNFLLCGTLAMHQMCRSTASSTCTTFTNVKFEGVCFEISLTAFYSQFMGSVWTTDFTWRLNHALNCANIYSPRKNRWVIDNLAYMIDIGLSHGNHSVRFKASLLVV